MDGSDLTDFLDTKKCVWQTLQQYRWTCASSDETTVLVPGNGVRSVNGGIAFTVRAASMPFAHRIHVASSVRQENGETFPSLHTAFAAT